MNLTTTRSHDPFSVKYVFRQYDNPEFNRELEKILLEENDRFKGYKIRGNLSGVETASRNLLDVIPEEFGRELHSITQEYFEANGFEVPSRFDLFGWGNILKDASHLTHSHSHTDLVINYYVKTPKDCSIVFIGPDWFSTHATTAKMHNYFLRPTEGLMVASPPWIRHEVPYSRELRMSISINVTVHR